MCLKPRKNFFLLPNLSMKRWNSQNSWQRKQWLLLRWLSILKIWVVPFSLPDSQIFVPLTVFAGPIYFLKKIYQYVHICSFWTVVLLEIALSPLYRCPVDMLLFYTSLSTRVLSCMAHWSSIFSISDFLPMLAFPFVKMFQNNHLVAFEVIATFVCEYWHHLS